MGKMSRQLINVDGRKDAACECGDTVHEHYERMRHVKKDKMTAVSRNRRKQPPGIASQRAVTSREKPDASIDDPLFHQDPIQPRQGQRR